MAHRSAEKLSAVEAEAVSVIRQWRSSVPGGEHLGVAFGKAKAMRSLIVRYNGHVKLRLRPIASELGIAMRTLERSFVAQYGTTMHQMQVVARLAYGQRLLMLVPVLKMSVIANLLGYDEVRDFNRFFEKQVHQSPGTWREEERNRLRSMTTDSQLGKA